MLEIDEDYQRVYCINIEKVYSLVRKWNFNKCEPVLVSPHPETATFAVIDGSHRMLAAGIRKEKYLLAVLTEGLSEDPAVRKIEEAELFSEQGEDVDHLSPSHKHRAYVTRGIKKYCVLDNCIKERRLLLNIHELKNLSKEKQDSLKAADYRVLSGYSAALQAASLVNGEEILNNVFNIIEDAGWHTATNGYGANVIWPEPDTFFAKAHAKYPGRKEKERLTMYLEEEVAKRLGIQPLYTGGDLRKVTSAINSHRRYGATGTENK